MSRRIANRAVSSDEIILAAADVMRVKGFNATSMRDIADKIGLSAASIYHHFTNKDFLLLAMLERQTEAALEVQQRIVSTDLAPAEKLTKMIHSHIRLITDHLALLSIHTFEIRSLINVEASFITRDGGKFRDEFVARRERYFATRKQFEACFSSVIAYGIETGAFRDVDVKMASSVILGAMHWIGVWFRENGRLSGDEVGESFADMLVAGLVAEPKPGRIP